MFNSCEHNFKSYGYARIVVMKHERDNNFCDGLAILMTDYFEDDKLLSDSDSQDWISCELENTDWIQEFLKDKPFGFYEILGRFYHTSWRDSYEYDEWESMWELRNVKWKQISYERAVDFDENGVFEDCGIALDDWIRITPYMSKRQILLEYAKFMRIEANHRTSIETLTTWFNSLADNAAYKEDVATILMERDVLVGENFQSEVS